GTAATRPGRGPADAAQGVRDVRDQLDLLEEACIDSSREPSTIARLVLTGPRLASGLSSVGHFDDIAGRFAAIGITGLVVHWPPASDSYQAALSNSQRNIA